MSSVLIVDDDEALCRSVEVQLRAEGYEVRSAGSSGEGLRLLEEWTPDLVLLDLRLPDGSGIDTLRRLQQDRPALPVVVVTGLQEMEVTIEAMRAGAFDYLRKPFEINDVFLLLEKVKRLAHPDTSRVSVGAVSEIPFEIVGGDKRMVEVVKQIGLLSRSRVTVLIEGETGTGKELVARALHRASSPDQPFVGVNCSAVVTTLSESELFGHEKGSFTGADTRKIGKLESAGKGTVFFDEIGDMPSELQAKLLRALEERKFERVGGLESIPFEARVTAATNRSLEGLVNAGEFREDLYYRLAVSRIVLPPLRERRSDVPLLVRHLLERIGDHLHRRIDAIEEEAMAYLRSYEWPGNVRELENVLTRAVALSRGSVLSAEEVKSSLGAQPEGTSSPAEVRPLRQMEKEHIRRALDTTGWNITHTARLLEISPTTLRKKIRDYGLGS